MRAPSWIKRLLRDRRGNVLAITAASMPLILGGAAMAIDTIQLSVWKRQLQRAADSAAIAGAHGESQGVDADDAVHRDLEENVFPTLSVPEVVVVGPSFGFNQTVRVSLTAQRTVPFLFFFTNTPNTITAEATAALTNDGEFCMLSLYDGTEAGINANGNANVDLICGMATNSRSDNAVTAGGGSSITADPITSVGGLNGETVTLDPGECRTTWNVGNGGILRLNPGVHYVTGDINLHGTIESTGTGGVTIIMTGTETNSDGDLVVGDFKQNGGGALDIDASETGDYRGIALYRDPRANLLTVKINGGADTDIQGAIYMPGTDLWLGGNAEMTAQCLQVVARIITFRGGADIGNSCPSGSASQHFNRTIVRLVG